MSTDGVQYTPGDWTATRRSTSPGTADLSATIREIAETIAEVTGFTGETEWDTSKPDDTPQELLDVSKLAEAGWTSKISLQEGLERTVGWYHDHVDSIRE